MKKITVILIFLLCAVTAFCQFPGNQGISSATTLLTINGGTKATYGLALGDFTDTTTANLNANMKGVPGLMIRTGNIVWVRNITANRWIQSGTYTATDGVYLSNTSFQWGQPVSTSGDPAALTRNTEIPLAAHTVSWRNGASTDVPNNRLVIDFSRPGNSSGDGLVTLFGETFGIIGFKTVLRTSGFARSQLDNTNTPTTAVQLGVNYNISASGFSTRNVFGGQIGQFFLGVKDNGFCDSCLGVFSNGTAQGIKLGAGNGGYIKFYGSVSEGGTEYGRFQAVTGRFGIGTNNPGQKLSVIGSVSATDSVMITTMLTGTASDSALVISGGLIKRVLQNSSGRATAQTGANTNILTRAVGATDATFVLNANVLVTASATNSFGVTVDYTDEGNTPRTVTVPFSQLAGTIITAITNVTGAGPYSGVSINIRAKSGTNIVFKTAGTFTSVTYNVDASVTQLN